MTNHIKAESIIVPEFKIVSTPTFRINDIKRRRFRLIDRYQSCNPRNPWSLIYGDILKRGYNVKVLSTNEDGIYRIDVDGIHYELEPGKQPVEKWQE